MHHDIIIDIPKINSFSELNFKGNDWETCSSDFLDQFRDGSLISIIGFGTMTNQLGITEMYSVELRVANQLIIQELNVIINKHNFPDGTKVLEVLTSRNGREYLHCHYEKV